MGLLTVARAATASFGDAARPSERLQDPVHAAKASCCHIGVLEALCADLHSTLQAVEDGGESLLMQPLLTGLPPALRGLCMPPAEASPAAKGRKSRAAAEAEAQPDHIEATPAQHDGCDAPDTFEAPGDMPDAPMGECHLGPALQADVKLSLQPSAS